MRAQKRWEKPRLIVLVRPKSQEFALGTCKISGSGADPGLFAGGCTFERTGQYIYCGTCQLTYST